MLDFVKLNTKSIKYIMSNFQKPIIAIIDSGIGGLSILKQLIEKQNVGNYLYVADNLYMPYGNKDEKWLKNRLIQIINYLKHNYNLLYIIIACNTASACLKDYNDKNLILLNFDKNKTYLATNLTKKKLPDINVVADHSLAKEIERNVFDRQRLKVLIRRHIKKLNLTSFDEIVLGCTHYELVEDIFKECCKNVKIRKNSEQIINNIEIDKAKFNDLNIVVLLSKQDNSYNEKIFKILGS